MIYSHREELNLERQDQMQNRDYMSTRKQINQHRGT